MSALLPFAHAWLWLGLAVSTSLASQPGHAPTDGAASELRGTYGNHGLWLSLGQGENTTTAEQPDAAVTELRHERRVEKADYVVLDLRNNQGVAADVSRAIALELWGGPPAPTQGAALSEAAITPRRLKADARVFVITDRHSASTCQQAIAAWKSQGATELAVPAAILKQDELAVEAWVLAAADAPRGNEHMAASPKAKRGGSP